MEGSNGRALVYARVVTVQNDRVVAHRARLEAAATFVRGIYVTIHQEKENA
jgi:hypothetical protein